MWEEWPPRIPTLLRVLLHMYCTRMHMYCACREGPPVLLLPLLLPQRPMYDSVPESGNICSIQYTNIEIPGPSILRYIVPCIHTCSTHLLGHASVMIVTLPAWSPIKCRGLSHKSTIEAGRHTSCMYSRCVLSRFALFRFYPMLVKGQKRARKAHCGFLTEHYPNIATKDEAINAPARACVLGLVSASPPHLLVL